MNGEYQGRIAAIINHRHNEFHKEKAGFFGFFESINDCEVASALLDAVCAWARDQGMEIIRGPFYFSMDDSPGVLLDGFDFPPVLLCGHTPRYYADLLERYGMVKYRDAYAYRTDLSRFHGDVNNLPPKILRVADIVRRRGRFHIRHADMSQWDQEVKRVMFLVNEAMGYMRNHVPMDEREFTNFTDDLKRIVDPELVLFAELNGEPIGFAATLPDINQILRRIDGRLWPFGWFHLWHGPRDINVATLKLLAVLKEHRTRGLDALFYVETARVLLRKGYDWLDMSLTAEDNDAINTLIRNLGMDIYKVYRIYYKSLRMD